MPEQFKMFSEIIPYVIAAELLVFCILQLRTNCLLKKAAKVRTQKKAAVQHLKEEVRTGESEIPVVRFETQKKQDQAAKKTEKKMEKEKQKSYDAEELAVLQEMMTEFFG